MIAIRSVALNNFRNYKNATVDFDKDNGVTFIYGDNGSGKSTILNAIHWCLYGDIVFHSTNESHSPRPLWGNSETVTEVSAVIEVNDGKYSFKRTAAAGGSDRGILTARLLENDGNSKEINPYQIESLIKKILPENIKNLFFLSENFSTDIFSHSSANSLKNNIYKISELDTVKKAIAHLDLTESDFIKNIDKSSKDYDRIQEYQQDIEFDRAKIKENEEAINKAEDKIAQHRDMLNKLKERLSSIKQLQQLLKSKELLKADLDDIDDRIASSKLDISEIVQKNYHKALLADGIIEYRNALSDAEAKGLIPAKIDTKVTAAILESGICICGRHIEDEQRKYIQEQHDKNENINKLKFLYGGKYQFSDIESQIGDSYYLLRDSFQTISDEEVKRAAKQEQFDDVCEELNGATGANLPDNPEQACRDHDESIVKWQDRRQQYGVNIRELKADITKKESAIRKLLGTNVSDAGEMQHQLERVRKLKTELEALMKKAEEVIRVRIEEGVWDSFSKILPSTQFTKVVIDENYTFGLITTQAYKADDSVLSVGEAKTLALSLVSTLSKDIGYSDSPLFIDNLFHGLDASHYNEITKCVEALSGEKQIFITYLYKDSEASGAKVSSYFKSDTIAQELRAYKGTETGDLCTIKAQEE